MQTQVVDMKYVLALDQGTTSSRAIVFDQTGQPVAIAQQEFPQLYPQPGWVEHDPETLWQTQAAVAVEAVAKAGIATQQVAAIGSFGLMSAKPIMYVCNVDEKDLATLVVTPSDDASASAYANPSPVGDQQGPPLQVEPVSTLVAR